MKRFNLTEWQIIQFFVLVSIAILALMVVSGKIQL